MSNAELYLFHKKVNSLKVYKLHKVRTDSYIFYLPLLFQNLAQFFTGNWITVGKEAILSAFPRVQIMLNWMSFQCFYNLFSILHLSLISISLYDPCFKTELAIPFCVEPPRPSSECELFGAKSHPSSIQSTVLTLSTFQQMSIQ